MNIFKPIEPRKERSMAKRIQRSCCNMKFSYLWAAIALAACSILISVELFNAHKPSARDKHESRLRVIPVPAGATGPESLVFDPDGEGPYTAVSDGRILKWQGQELGWLEYAATTPQHLLNECKKRSQGTKTEHLCGRPLGIQFHKMTRDLYIADAYLGLLMVRPGENFSTAVVTQVDGLPLHFTNGLDIAQDTGVVYFTDSSQRFRRREFLPTVISGDKSGRLVSYDPRNKEVKVLMSELTYPNGIAVSRDSSYLLVTETTTCRILRYSLKLTETKVAVLVKLPGFPDNIKPSPRGGFWVAFYSRRGKVVEWLLSFPLCLREVFIWLPLDLNEIFSLFSRWLGRPMAMRISEEGEVLQVLENFGGEIVKYISDVEEKNGTLWIGSVVMPHVGVYKL